MNYWKKVEDFYKSITPKHGSVLCSCVTSRVGHEDRDGGARSGSLPSHDSLRASCAAGPHHHAQSVCYRRGCRPDRVLLLQGYPRAEGFEEVAVLLDVLLPFDCLHRLPLSHLLLRYRQDRDLLLLCLL